MQDEIKKFIEKLAGSQKDIDPEISAAVDKHFFDMIAEPSQGCDTSNSADDSHFNDEPYECWFF